MSRSVYLYKNATLNEDDATHVFFNDPADYVDFLNNKYGAGQRLTVSSYAINNNVFKSGYLAEYWKDYTYIIEYELSEEGNYAYFKAYKVTSAKAVSGMVVYTLEVDLWATFIAEADISHIHVNRCNRKLDGGIYDDIAEASGNMQQNAVGGLLVSILSLAAVCKISYNLSATISGSDTITNTGLFYIPLIDIYNLVNEGASSADNVPIVEQISDVLGGIYATSFGVKSNAVTVTNCWIVPLAAISRGYLSIPLVKTKCILTGFDDKTFNTIQAAAAGIYEQTLHLGENYYNNMPQNKLYFGGYYNGIPLLRSIDDDAVLIRYTFGSDYVKVEIEQGDTQQDVTRSFELPVTTSNETKTTLQQISDVLGDMLGTFKRQAAGLAMGGAKGAALATATAVASRLKDVSQPDNVMASSGKGDAKTALYYDSGDKSGSYTKPYYYIGLVKSRRNEKLHAYLEGAKFDLYADALGFGGIAARDHLGEDSSGLYTTDTYIMADCDVEGVPKDAKNYIANELRRGIYYVVV